MSIKHAYLIIAHNQFALLKLLVSLLDDARNDIFIHIDKKAEMPSGIETKYSNVCFLEKRIDVRWGDYSQIEVEMSLFNEAVSSNERYSYYHLISGTHLPLFGQNYIHDYFTARQGSQFFANLSTTEYQTNLKVRRYNFFTRNFADSNKRIAKICQVLWRMGHVIQEKLGVSINDDTEFAYASNWVSLTHEAVQYIVSQKKHIKQLFSFSLCGDEYFVPTILKKSDREWRIIYSDELLKQEIGDANAKTYTDSDYDMLVSSNCLFARKFSEDNKLLISRILDLVVSRS